MRMAGKAWVRRITVKGTRYVQTVRQTLNKPPQLIVLSSFGKESMESLMRAGLYATAFNELERSVKKLSGEILDETTWKRLREAVFAVYGWILDREAIESILGKDLGGDEPPA